MNTIEQAREVSASLHLHIAANGDTVLLEKAVDAIDALIAELAALLAANRDLVYQFDALRVDYLALKSQEPVDAVLLEDMVEGSHPQYGRALFTTDNCVKGVYLSAGAQPAPTEEPDKCWCDVTGTGEPGVTCGDCPRDYKAAPEQTQECKPLTDELIEDLRGDANRGFNIDKNDYFKAFRDAESAHGIKEQP